MTPKTISKYIANFPPKVQAVPQTFRETVRKAAPGAEETISYGIPCFTLDGNLVHFAAFKKHVGFYPRSTAIAKFKKELSAYEVSKGTIRFPLGKPLPVGLIGKMVKFRVKEDLGRAPRKKL